MKIVRSKDLQILREACSGWHSATEVFGATMTNEVGPRPKPVNKQESRFMHRAQERDVPVSATNSKHVGLV